MIQSRSLPPDTDLLALHRQAPSRYPLLLESVASGTAQGRWDMLLATDGTGLQLDTQGQTRTLGGDRVEGDFLSALDAEWQARRVAPAIPHPVRRGNHLPLDRRQACASVLACRVAAPSRRWPAACPSAPAQCPRRLIPATADSVRAPADAGPAGRCQEVVSGIGSFDTRHSKTRWKRLQP